ncbi:hypothetical protein Bca4012_010385 [Brassica carinata]
MTRDKEEELSESDEEEPSDEPSEEDKEEELSESDEEEPSDEPSEEMTLEEGSEADDIEENQHQRDVSSGLANVWSGPVTRSRLRAQEKSLHALLQIVGAGPRREDQDKPACWFNLIAM